MKGFAHHTGIVLPRSSAIARTDAEPSSCYSVRPVGLHPRFALSEQRLRCHYPAMQA